MRALLVLATALFAVPALGAEIVAVRVGNHPTFTRVVFELDAPAGYRIERRAKGGISEILITIEAGSTPRSLSKRTEMVERVAVQDGRDRSIAHIRLKQQPSRVKEMILADPPRLVFDLVLPEVQLAAIRAKAAGKKAAAAKTAPKAETPKTVTAKAPEPPKAKPAPKPQPKAEPKPAPKPAPVAQVKPAPAPKVQPKPEPKAEPKPAVVARTEPPKAAPAPKPPETPTAKPPVVAIEPDEAVVAKEPVAKPTMPDQPKPAVRPAPKPVAKKPEPKPSPDGGMLANIDWPLWGGAAAGVLFLVIVLVLWMRRRSLPNDMDVTALAQEAGVDSGDSASEFAFGADSEKTVSEGFSSSIDLPDPKTSADGPAFTAGPGMDDDSEKENEMDSETPDLTMGRTASEMPTQVGGAAAGGDVGRMLSELERRVAQVEARLDESIDARERLERQVAAQAEELRVQRAAIARTQRALRSLNRGEEEQATEPAIREPSS